MRPLALVQPRVPAVAYQLAALNSALLKKALEGVGAQPLELLQAEQAWISHREPGVGYCAIWD